MKGEPEKKTWEETIEKGGRWGVAVKEIFGCPIRKPENVKP